MRFVSYAIIAALSAATIAPAHAAAPASITGISSSAAAVDRGGTVRLTTTMKASGNLTKSGYLRLIVRDPSGAQVNEFRTNFSAVKAGATVNVTADFAVAASAPTGAYKLEASAWSPDVSVNTSLANAFKVSAPAVAKASLQMGAVGVSSTTVAPGGRITYFVDATPSRALASAGYFTLTLETASRQVIDKATVNFKSLPGGTAFRAAKDYIVPANLAPGKYTVEVSAWSPEVSGWVMQAGAFEVSRAINGVCGASSGQPTIGVPGALCLSGTGSAPVLNGTRYTWSCTGGLGGTSSACAADLQGATCGASSQQPLGNTPRAGLCLVGTASAVEWTPKAYLWSCSDAATKTAINCTGAYSPPANNLTVFKGAGADGVAAIGQFNRWLGREVDYYLVNLNQNDWSALLSSTSWAVGSLPMDKRLVVSIPMLVANDYSGSFWADGVKYSNMVMPKGTLAMGAAGYYDNIWLVMAQTLVKYHRQNAVVRLGWEMNLTQQPWSAAQDPASYRAYFARIVQIMRSVPGANFEFDWCPNIHTQAINPELAYPGDAYVDYIGLDVYDQVWSASMRDPAARWNYYYNGTNGIRWMLDFANAHGKKKSFPEWGAGGGFTSNGAGDSPYFVQQMAQVIKANGIGYAGYWDTNTAYTGKLSDNQYPLIGAEFLKDFGAAR